MILLFGFLIMYTANKLDKNQFLLEKQDQEAISKQ